MTRLLPERAAIAGDDDACAHAALLWSARRDDVVRVGADDADTAAQLTAPRLFGDPPAVVVWKANSWPAGVVDDVVAGADAILVCYVTDKAPSSTQRKKWGGVLELTVADARWRQRAILDVFSSAGITLDNDTRALLVNGGTLATARSVATAATWSGIRHLDRRKAALLGAGGVDSDLYAAMSALFDEGRMPDADLTAGIDAVRGAGVLAGELVRMLVAVNDGDLDGAPWMVRRSTERGRRWRNTVETAFVTAAALERDTRRHALHIDVVFAQVHAALTTGAV